MNVKAKRSGAKAITPKMHKPQTWPWLIKHVKEAFKPEIYEIQINMLFRCAGISWFQVVTE